MKSLLFIFFTIFCFGNGLSAQSLALEVVANAGDYAENSSGSLSWTVGELVTETIGNAGIILSQGFHQFNLNLVSTSEKLPFSVKIFPNPITEFLQIEMDAAQTISIQIFDVMGKIAYQSSQKSNTVFIEMRTLSAGTYFLKLIDQNTKKTNIYSIIKIR
jgi:hypothetical protein